MSTSTLPTFAEAFESAVAKLASQAEDGIGLEVVIPFSFSLDNTGTFTHSGGFPIQLPLKYTLTIQAPDLIYVVTVQTNWGYYKQFTDVGVNLACSDTIQIKLEQTTATTTIQSTPNTEGGHGTIGLQLVL